MRSSVAKGRAISRAASAKAIAAALLVAAPAGAQYIDGGPARAPTFDVAAHPEFGDPREGITAIMRRYRTHKRGPQHFCVVGYRYPDGGRSAYILWREGRRRILWEGTNDPAYRTESILWSRRKLNMDTDVVPDGVFNSSTYMIFESEKRDVENDCAKYGRHYVLPYPKRRAPGPAWD